MTKTLLRPAVLAGIIALLAAASAVLDRSGLTTWLLAGLASGFAISGSV